MVPLPVRGREVVTRRSEDRRPDLVARARTRSLGPIRRYTAEFPYSPTVNDGVRTVSDLLWAAERQGGLAARGWLSRGSRPGAGRSWSWNRSDQKLFRKVRSAAPRFRTVRDPPEQPEQGVCSPLVRLPLRTVGTSQCRPPPETITPPTRSAQPCLLRLNSGPSPAPARAQTAAVTSSRRTDRPSRSSRRTCRKPMTGNRATGLPGSRSKRLRTPSGNGRTSCADADARSVDAQCEYLFCTLSLSHAPGSTTIFGADGGTRRFGRRAAPRAGAVVPDSHRTCHSWSGKFALTDFIRSVTACTASQCRDPFASLYVQHAAR